MNLEPQSKFFETVYRIDAPAEIRSGVKTDDLPFLYIGVDRYGFISSIADHSFWRGKPWSSLTYEERLEVYDWLLEWDMIGRKRVGYDDYEWVATPKLTGEEE